MKPSPPVTKMFFTLASGVNAVWPVSTGASCQVPFVDEEARFQAGWAWWAVLTVSTVQHIMS